MRQPPRVLRGLLAAAGAGLVVAAVTAAFGSLHGVAPEFKPPRPSTGNWASEEDFIPDVLDEVSSPALSSSSTPACAPGS